MAGGAVVVGPLHRDIAPAAADPPPPELVYYFGL
jgi:hypothetical protein